MIRKNSALLAVFVLLTAGLFLPLQTKAVTPDESAVTPDDFLIDNMFDLAELCSTSQNDPIHTAAANFCQGYVVGAYHYYRALTSKPGEKPLFCLPNPQPSRNEAIGLFVAWARANPQYNNEPAVEALFKFAIEKWPCRP